MAVFTIINKDRRGRDALYTTGTDLYKLISYVCEKSCSVGGQGIYLIGRQGITNQFLYSQKCSGKKLIRRARHYVLSFDTSGWEWQITAEDIERIMPSICAFVFRNHQCLWGVHNKYNNRHVHIIVNPVSIVDQKVLHWSITDFNNAMHEIAIILYNSLGVALQSVSYIKEDGTLRIDPNDQYHFLYENRRSSSIPLKNKVNGKVTAFS